MHTCVYILNKKWVFYIQVVDAFSRVLLSQLCHEVPEPPVPLHTHRTLQWGCVTLSFSHTSWVLQRTVQWGCVNCQKKGLSCPDANSHGNLCKICWQARKSSLECFCAAKLSMDSEVKRIPLHMWCDVNVRCEYYSYVRVCSMLLESYNNDIICIMLLKIVHISGPKKMFSLLSVLLIETKLA